VNSNTNIAGGPKALLASVDPAAHLACVEALAAAGFSVLNDTQSGTAMITIAREKQPEIILLDQHLSDVSAVEAIKWLRTMPALRDIPIIIVGGKRVSQQPDDRVTVLPRPINRERVLKALKVALTSQPRIDH
jgi:CheY-like chemotaxis protein